MVTCNQTCLSVRISLEAENGDPDIYARETSKPNIQNSNCNICPLCKARSSELTDSCPPITTTNGSTFYTTIVAHKRFNEAKINFTGENLLDVTEVSNVTRIVKTIGRANIGNRKVYNVTCNGLCQDVSITLKVSRGDADLYSSEDSPPALQGSDCRSCQSMCRSRSDSLSDSCHGINTSNGNTFYTTVVAHKAYSNAILTFTGENILSVD